MHLTDAFATISRAIDAAPWPASLRETQRHLLAGLQTDLAHVPSQARRIDPGPSERERQAKLQGTSDPMQRRVFQEVDQMREREAEWDF